MQYELPEAECNQFNGDYIDSYNNGIRVRYYLHEGSLIPSSSTTYYNIPSGAYCLTSDDVIAYRPDFTIYSQVISFLIFALSFLLVYKTIMKRLLP